MMRLLGLLGGLSTALDLGTGAPMEESLRRCVMATRLGRAAGLPDEVVADALYAALLEHLGCTAYTHELAAALGDDISAVRASFLSDPSSPVAMLRTMIPMVAEASGHSRTRVLAAALRSGNRIDAEGPAATCEVARNAAARLGLPASVQEALGHTTAMWDGSSHPPVSGDAIPLLARLGQVASVATMFTLAAGPAYAVAEVRRREGTQLDPALALLVTEELLTDIADLDPCEEVLALEPDPVRRVSHDELPDVARTFGDLVDLKSPWLHGHSTAVGDLAASAGACLAMAPEEQQALRVAGYLHDLGRIGVSSRIWDQSRALTTSERAQVELHPWHTEQILGRVPELRDIAALAVAHHERLDGSGYHRRAVAAQLPTGARVLAAADRYRCLVEERPHRPAVTAERAAAAVTAEARAGALDADAVAAVLEAAGHLRRSRRPRPGGLTERQVDVLRLLAAGRSNRQIAADLVISPRTAEHHVQDLYARIGVSTRAGAAVFAMEHGLLLKSG
ncbi:HD domain-containing phosphohydrolase [Nocardioides limicola]|uniref:HD domain-containing phosphohydrolase n=1 Tax=Nocardioides limicola TaxID=2803368 RepID=UPI00193C39BC|nr:HD domain-containing phosphohydrolase [Nocardioides sp. DJM-14]